MQIVNIVLSGSFGQAIDVSSLKALDCAYSKMGRNFPGCAISLSSAKLLAYRTGKYIITGVKSFDLIDGLWKETVEILKPVLDVSLFETPVISNAVGYENLGRPLNLMKIITALHDEDAEYEPEVFPGLIWRTKAGTANIFQNGKIILLGCKSEKELEALRDFMAERLIGV